MASFKQDHDEANFGTYEELPSPIPTSMAAKKLLLEAKETKGDLSGISYENGSSFFRCQFTKARGIIAPHARFIECDFKNANLWDADIPSCIMLVSKLFGVNLQQCNGRFSNFANAVMTKAFLGYESGGSGKNKSKAGIFNDSNFMEQSLKVQTYKAATLNGRC